MFRNSGFALTASALCLGSSARADDAEDKAVALAQKLYGKIKRDEKAPGKPAASAPWELPPRPPTVAPRQGPNVPPLSRD